MMDQQRLAYAIARRKLAQGNITIEELSQELLEDIKDIAVEVAGNETAATTAFDSSKYASGHILYNKQDVQKAIEAIGDSSATTTASGLMSKEDKIKLNGIAAGANNYVHPSTHAATMITEDATHRFVTDSEKSTWNAKETTTGAQTKATKALTDAKAYTDTAVAGLVDGAPEALNTLKELADAMQSHESAYDSLLTVVGGKAEKTYVDQELAKKDNYGNWNLKVNSETTGQTVSSKTDVVIKGGGATTVARSGGTVTISSTNTTYTGSAGITLSGTDFRHSNSITAGTVQSGSGAIAHGGTFTVPKVTYDAQGHITAVGTNTYTLPAQYSHPNSGATAGTYDSVTVNAQGHVTAGFNNFATCSTAAATAAKVVTLVGFALTTGARIAVKFSGTNTAASPTLNVNGTGAKAIFYRGAAITAGYLADKRVYEFIYDGTNWELVGDIDTNTNTTYTATGGITLTGTQFKHTNNVTAGTVTPSSGAVSFGGTVSIPKVSYDANGHVTAVVANTITLPSLPIASTGTAGIIQIGTGASNAAAGNHGHNAVTTSANGFMSSADKTKLDGLNKNNSATSGDFLWNVDRILQEIAKIRIAREIVEVTTTVDAQKTVTFSSTNYIEGKTPIEVRIGSVIFNESRYTVSGNTITLATGELGITKGRKVQVVIHYMTK